MADRMKEKVARAMFRQDHDEGWDQGEDRTKGIYLNNTDAALEECHFEELVTALKDAQNDLADTLEASLDCACPHDAHGAIIRDEMDEASRPMISNMERLLAKIDAVLAKVDEGHA